MTPKDKLAAAWKVTKAEKKRTGPLTRLLARLRRHREPSAFQRCLAVHIHFAGPRGGLS